MRLFRLTGLLTAAVVALTGCPGTPNPPPPAAPTITAFTATPESVTTGDAITLTWQTAHATTFAITYGDSQTVDVTGLNAGTGTTDVTIDTAGEYTFTLTATGVDGASPASVTATATVTVANPPEPVVASFTATPSAIAIGGTVSLAWEVQNAEQIAIADDAGNAVDLGSAGVATGSVDVAPTANTTYTLTATGRGGETTADVSVTVYPLPVVDTFAASRKLATAGDDVILTWATSNATTVGIVDDAGTPVLENGDPAGTITVNPLFTRTYTLTATGDGGSVTGDVTVQVVPVVLDFTVEPTEVRAGDAVTLTWHTEGATVVGITGPGGYTYTPTPGAIATGQTTTTVDVAGDFTLQATSGDLSDEMVVPVTVTDAPRVRTLVVDPDALTAGEKTTVSWTIDGVDLSAGDTVSLTQNGQPVDLSGVADPSTGPVAVTLPDAGDVTFTLTATNASGSHSLSHAATVFAVPAIDAFAALPTRVASGQSTQISWATTDATSVRITKDGADLTSVTPTDTTGTVTDVLTADAAYVLHATNAIGYEVTSDPITVTVGAPVITAFDAAPRRVAADSPVTFSWTNQGGTSLDLTDATGTSVFSTTDTSQIAAGTATANAPAALGDYDYTLTVSDPAGGSDTSLATVTVTDGPIIQSFITSKSLVTTDRVFTLAWQVTDDQAATPVVPTLALTDDQGNTYDVSAIDPNNGSIDLVFTTQATLTFTLTASTAGTTPDTASVTVQAVAPPVIDAFAAASPVLSTEGGTVTPSTDLTWQTHDATAVKLYQLTGPNSQTLLHTAADTEIASGTYTATVPSTTIYRLDAINAAGTVASSVVKVSVDIPIVDTFTGTMTDGTTGTHLDIVKGESVTLDWATQDADHVTLTPLDPTMTETTAAEAFVDLSTSPTATALAPAAAYKSEAAVTFPTGFTFPYYGRAMSSVMADTSGYLNFDPSQSPTTSNATFPSTATPKNGVIAAFWDDLDAGTSGTMYADSGTDANGNYVAIMWKNYTFHTATYGPADLNFEVFLYDTGRIQFRYGTMTSAADTAGHMYADGLSADAGFENFYGHNGVSFVNDAAFPGGLANRSFAWTFHTHEGEIADTFEDVSANPTAMQLTMSGSTDTGMGAVTFPAGFYFPYYGQMLSSCVASTNGYLAFDEKATNTGSETALPSKSNPNGGVIAPFWNDLDSKSAGTIWTDSGSNANGRYVVIEWKNYAFWTSSHNPSDLNFEVFLYESGRIEFRYGDMIDTGSSAASSDYAGGYSAAVGYEDFAGLNGFELSYFDAMPGEYAHRAWAFDMFAPTAGSQVVTPTEDTTYSLAAVNANGYNSAQVSVGVWGDLSTAVPTFNLTPSPAEEGDTVTIAWAVSEAASAQVTLGGQPLTDCSSTADPGAHVTSGTCTVPAGTRGTYDYTLSYSNPVSNGSTTKTLTVYPKLEITSFNSSAEFVNSPATTVTVTWTATNATGVILRLNGGANVITTENPNGDSYTVDLTATTEFTLSISDDNNRYRAATLTVYVDAAHIDTLTASQPQVGAGTPVTLSWTATNAQTVSTNPYLVSAQETTDAFIDISGTGTELTMSSATSTSGYGTFTFPGGFSFPYYGSDRTQAKVGVDGVMYFDTSKYLYSGGYELPSTSFGMGGVLAPFWDSQVLKASADSTQGHVLYELRYDGTQYYLVIEWMDTQFSTSSWNPASLNYEVVLYEDGTFDYRYGSMTSQTDTSGDYYADGASASIAFDDDTGTIGYSMSYNTAVAGGLSNRSFRFRTQFKGNDSITVTPNETSTYTVCATGGGYTDCQDITIVVVKPGDMMFTELMINPSAVPDSDGEWFEMRNTSAVPIDISGFTVTDGEDTYTVPAGSAPVQPGQFIVFARNGDPALNGGVTADFVYGTAAPNLLLSQSADDLTMASGATVIDSVSYDTANGWTVPNGASLSLDSSWEMGDPTANDVYATATDPVWCTSSETMADGDFGSPGSRGTGCRLIGGYQFDPAGASFIDISATGTPLPGAVGDEVYTQVPGGIGFTMPYFNDTVTDLWVSSNGFLSFAPLTSAKLSNYAIDSASTPNGIVAPFWDDMDDRSDGTSNVYYQLQTVNGHQVMIVQWNNFQRFGSSYTGWATFEVQLWDNGDVALAFDRLEPEDPSSSTSVGYYKGSSATVGMKSMDGLNGIQYSYNSQIVYPTTRILFLKP